MPDRTTPSDRRRHTFIAEVASARRALEAAERSGDAALIRSAHSRLAGAKLALGGRREAPPLAAPRA